MNADANVFDEAALAGILALSEVDLAERLVETRQRMRDALPTKCFDDVLDWSRGRTTAYAVVLGEAALSSLGQAARPMCDRLDALGAEHNTLAGLADDYNRLASGADTKNLVVRRLASNWLEQRDLFRSATEMTFARLLGLRSVLHVQLQRESFERDGMHVPDQWRLPIVVDDGSSPPPELELVEIDPDPAPPGGGGEGGASGAEANHPETDIGTDSERQDRNRDGLGFLDI